MRPTVNAPVSVPEKLRFPVTVLVPDRTAPTMVKFVIDPPSKLGASVTVPPLKARLVKAVLVNVKVPPVKLLTPSPLKAALGPCVKLPPVSRMVPTDAALNGPSRNPPPPRLITPVFALTVP